MELFFFCFLEGGTVKMEKFDFGGWATRNDIKCSDGRTIRKNAFADCDGMEVPLVWNHLHDDPDNVLGHAMLKNEDSGVYAYGKFNDSPSGKLAKELVKNHDVKHLSIYANQLKQNGGDVLHGAIREVSLVLAGANPGAYIDTILAHSDDSDEAAIINIHEDSDSIELYHSDSQPEEKKETKAEVKTDAKEEKETKEMSTPNSNDKTIKEIFDTLNEEQKTVVYALIGQALEDAQGGGSENEEDEDMKHNVFDNDMIDDGDALIHTGMEVIIKDAKRQGSLRESFLAHADEYGIKNIDYLFPDAKNFTDKPEFIQREMGWVQKVMSGVHHTPFSRIKSMFADITADEARAKGYIKGKMKKEEVFSLLKRTTTPTTIYKKQKMDRDDVIDITDFDVIAWLKSEMRMMLDEEIARAILIGDGRLASDDNHIKTDNIRPIALDEDLYNIKADVNVATGATGADKAKAFIDSVIRSRKDYKGSGNPTLYTTEDLVTECLLLEDKIGHKVYKTEAELATTLRVKEIVTVEVMEGFKDKDQKEVAGIVVNLADYNVGADKGGEINMFDDFDIDYNQQKYLIETRCSGALVKPYSAITLAYKVAAA